MVCLKTYMLTPFQRQLYDYWKIAPKDDSLVIEPHLPLSNDVDVEALIAESQKLIKDVWVLHTRVIEAAGEPRLLFVPAITPRWEVVNLSDDEADEYISHQHHLLDLNKGPMARFVVIVTPTRKFLKSAISNMLCDGWSISMIANRIPFGTMNHWTSISKEQNQFPMYLEQLEALRASFRFERDREWWIEYMKGVDRLTDFAVREEYEVGKVILKRRIFDKASIDAACQKQKISVIEALLTAWAMALRDMTAVSESLSTITFITLNRGRTRRQMDVLGNFLIEKALRVDIAVDDTIVEVMRKVRRANFVTNLHSLFTEQDLEPYIGDCDQGTCVIYNEDMDHAESIVDGVVPHPCYPEPTETCEFLSGILWGRKDKYELEVTYSEPLYREEDVDRFVERVVYWFNECL